MHIRYQQTSRMFNSTYIRLIQVMCPGGWVIWKDKARSKLIHSFTHSLIFAFHSHLQLSYFFYPHGYTPDSFKWTSSLNLWGLIPPLFLFPSFQKGIGRVWSYRSTIIYGKRTLWKTYFPYSWFRELKAYH